MSRLMRSESGDEGRALEVGGAIGVVGVTLTLSALGAVVGAGSGAMLTFAGNLISGYEVVPSLGVYLWNSTWFAALGATAAPTATWASMRSVPLWKAVAVPPLTGLVSGIAAMVIMPSAFVLSAVGGVAASVLALRRGHEAAGEATNGVPVRTASGEIATR